MVLYLDLRSKDLFHTKEQKCFAVDDCLALSVLLYR